MNEFKTDLEIYLIAQMLNSIQEKEPKTFEFIERQIYLNIATQNMQKYDTKINQDKFLIASKVDTMQNSRLLQALKIITLSSIEGVETWEKRAKC